MGIKSRETQKTDKRMDGRWWAPIMHLNGNNLYGSTICPMHVKDYRKQTSILTLESKILE